MSGPAAAQVPVLPGQSGAPGTTESTASRPESPEQLKEQLEKSLDTARRELAEMDAPGAQAAPAEITPAEVADRRSDLVRTVFAIERHLKHFATAPGLAEAVKEAERRESEWKGFEEKPPYSFLFFDELRNQRDAAHAKVAAYASTASLIERQISAMQQEFRQKEESYRRAADVMARARGGPDEAAAAWRLDSARIRMQAVGSALALYQASLASQQPRIAAAKSELNLLERQVKAAEEQVVFTEEDIRKAEENAAAKIKAYDKEIFSLSRKQSEVLAERDRLRAEVADLREKQPDEAAGAREELELAEARLRGAEAEADLLSFQLDLLGAATRMHGEWPQALRQRRALEPGNPADRRTEARRELQAIGERIQGWSTFITNERAAVAAAVREQESRLANLPQDDPRVAAEQRVLAGLWRKIEVIERLDQLISSSGPVLERWLADGAELEAQRSAGARVGDFFSQVWSWIRKVWGYEVYRYEDKLEVNGETITVMRGLSLGWLLGAILFFFLAYRMGSWASRKLQRVLTGRGWIGEVQARTLRRWFMVGVACLLVFITLQMLRIPVTAFAFLGGALAIGFGFGTQTLFKNLISGIILLAERKVKAGDILEVDGIIGTVTTVDTRSSTIRGFDGVETLVPNSLLLENKVTNWTLSSSKVRRIVRVGVAYGSPVQRVSEILSDCAARHGLVLKDPAPMVVFEDFGADAMVFALYFWVELSERSNSMVTASDLRFMIEKRFSEAGIVIAFPQRDLHLTSAVPLQVAMQRPPRREVPDDPPGA